MTLTELRYLVALADQRHFGCAAEFCNVSQPSLSTQILKLAAAGRRDELSRMLGGLEISRETRAHAKQMLERAQSA